MLLLSTCSLNPASVHITGNLTVAIESTKAVYRRLSSFVLFINSFMTIRQSFLAYAAGLAIAAPIAFHLYTSNPAYKQFIDWQFQNPVVLVPAAILGLVAGRIFD